MIEFERFIDSIPNVLKTTFHDFATYFLFFFNIFIISRISKTCKVLQMLKSFVGLVKVLKNIFLKNSTLYQAVVLITSYPDLMFVEMLLISWKSE